MHHPPPLNPMLQHVSADSIITVLWPVLGSGAPHLLSKNANDSYQARVNNFIIRKIEKEKEGEKKIISGRRSFCLPSLDKKRRTMCTRDTRVDWIKEDTCNAYLLIEYLFQRNHGESTANIFDACIFVLCSTS